MLLSNSPRHYFVHTKRHSGVGNPLWLRVLWQRFENKGTQNKTEKQISKLTNASGDVIIKNKITWIWPQCARLESSYKLLSPGPTVPTKVPTKHRFGDHQEPHPHRLHWIHWSYFLKNTRAKRFRSNRLLIESKGNEGLTKWTFTGWVT